MKFKRRKVKLEDEGYYLCKVMAENESLKRVVYVRVIVDLTLSYFSENLRKINEGDSFKLTCNTSYVLPAISHINNRNTHDSPQVDLSSSSSSSSFSLPSSSPMAQLLWYKDNILISDYKKDEETATGLIPLTTSSKHFQIENYKTPTLSSTLYFISLSKENFGVYTCRFRYQNVSFNIHPSNGLFFSLFSSI
jgi:hypothetical protein